MSCTFEKVISLAKSHIGYQEVDKNGNKFATYIDKNYPDFYNGKKAWSYDSNGVAHGGAEWCDIFIDAIVLMCSETEAEALYVLCQPKLSAGAGCKYSYEYYKSNGCAGNEPKVGAQIFFNNFSHTGLVIDVTDDSVITVEGNSGNSVKKHTYKKSSSKICGYGYPRYRESVKNDKYDFPTIPARGYFKHGDKGPEVKKMQVILEAVCPGCLPKYGSDGDFGDETFKAVNRVQFTVHTTVDGKYGPKTNEACKKHLSCI